MTIRVDSTTRNSTMNLIEEFDNSSTSSDDTVITLPAIVVTDDKKHPPLVESHEVTIDKTSPSEVTQLKALVDFLYNSPACASKKDEIKKIRNKIHGSDFPTAFKSIKRFEGTVNKRKTSLMNRLTALKQSDLDQLILSSNNRFELEFMQLAKPLKVYLEGKLTSSPYDLCENLIDMGLYRIALELTEANAIETDRVYALIASYYAKQGKVKAALQYFYRMSDGSQKKLGLIKTVATPLLKNGFNKKGLEVIRDRDVSSIDITNFLLHFQIQSSKDFHPELLIQVIRKQKSSECIDEILDMVIRGLLEIDQVETAIAFLLKNDLVSKRYPTPLKYIVDRLGDDGNLQLLRKFTREIKRRKSTKSALAVLSSKIKVSTVKAYLVQKKFAKARRYIDRFIKSDELKNATNLLFANHLLKNNRYREPLKILESIDVHRIRYSHLSNRHYLEHETFQLAVIALIKRNQYKKATKLINKIPEEHISTSFARLVTTLEALKVLVKRKRVEDIPLVLEKISITKKSISDPQIKQFLKLLAHNNCFDYLKAFSTRFKVETKLSDVSEELAKDGDFDRSREVALLIPSKFSRNIALLNRLVQIVVKGKKVDAITSKIDEDFKKTDRDKIFSYIVEKLLREKNSEKEAKALFALIKDKQLKHLTSLLFFVHQTQKNIEKQNYDNIAKSLANLKLNAIIKERLRLGLCELLVTNKAYDEIINLLHSTKDKFIMERELLNSYGFFVISRELLSTGNTSVLMKILGTISTPVNWNSAIDQCIQAVKFKKWYHPETVNVFERLKKPISDDEMRSQQKQLKKIEAKEKKFESSLNCYDPSNW